MNAPTVNTHITGADVKPTSTCTVFRENTTKKKKESLDILSFKLSTKTGNQEGPKKEPKYRVVDLGNKNKRASPGVNYIGGKCIRNVELPNSPIGRYSVLNLSVSPVRSLTETTSTTYVKQSSGSSSRCSSALSFLRPAPSEQYRTSGSTEQSNGISVNTERAPFNRNFQRPVQNRLSKPSQGTLRQHSFHSQHQRHLSSSQVSDPPFRVRHAEIDRGSESDVSSMFSSTFDNNEQDEDKDFITRTSSAFTVPSNESYSNKDFRSFCNSQHLLFESNIETQNCAISQWSTPHEKTDIFRNVKKDNYTTTSCNAFAPLAFLQSHAPRNEYDRVNKDNDTFQNSQLLLPWLNSENDTLNIPANKMSDRECEFLRPLDDDGGCSFRCNTNVPSSYSDRKNRISNMKETDLQLHGDVFRPERTTGMAPFIDHDNLTTLLNTKGKENMLSLMESCVSPEVPDWIESSTRPFSFDQDMHKQNYERMRIEPLERWKKMPTLESDTPNVNSIICSTKNALDYLNPTYFPHRKSDRGAMSAERYLRPNSFERQFPINADESNGSFSATNTSYEDPPTENFFTSPPILTNTFYDDSATLGHEKNKSTRPPKGNYSPCTLCSDESPTARRVPNSTEVELCESAGTTICDSPAHATTSLHREQSLFNSTTQTPERSQGTCSASKNSAKKYPFSQDNSRHYQQQRISGLAIVTERNVDDNPLTESPSAKSISAVSTKTQRHTHPENQPSPTEFDILINTGVNSDKDNQFPTIRHLMDQMLDFVEMEQKLRFALAGSPKHLPLPQFECHVMDMNHCVNESEVRSSKYSCPITDLHTTSPNALAVDKIGPLNKPKPRSTQSEVTDEIYEDKGTQTEVNMVSGSCQTEPKQHTDVACSPITPRNTRQRNNNRKNANHFLPPQSASISEKQKMEENSHRLSARLRERDKGKGQSGLMISISTKPKLETQVGDEGCCPSTTEKLFAKSLIDPEQHITRHED